MDILVNTDHLFLSTIVMICVALQYKCLIMEGYIFSQVAQVVAFVTDLREYVSSGL